MASLNLAFVMIFTFWFVQLMNVKQNNSEEKERKTSHVQ